ncbi:MAG: type II secretion system F family protein, partial [Ruthenibacterium sp.]
VLFTQMAIMLRAGVSLSLALEVLAGSEPNKRLRKVLGELHADLLGGVALSDAMAKFVCFDAITINLVRAGEADGHLERSFTQVADISEKQNNLRSKIVSASIYPMILLVLVIGVLTLLNTMVLPSFVTMFEAIGTGLPALTVAVMGFSAFFNKWWWLIALLVLALLAGYQALYRTRHGFALAVDRFKLHIPVVGTLIRQASIARFSRIVSALLASGQDFLSSLAIGRSVLGNRYMQDGFARAAEEVRVGNSVSMSMQSLPFLDGVYISMLRAGEESGSLSDTLDKMADLYEAQTDATTKRLITLMEPMMTVVIAGVVGVVVIAIALPMFGMFDLVGNL